MVLISSKDGSVTVDLRASGVASIMTGATILELSEALLTTPAFGTLGAPSHCVLSNPPAFSANNTVQQNYDCRANATQTSIIIEDAFLPMSASIMKRTTIVAKQLGAPFSTALRSSLRWDAGGGSTRLWLPWTKGCVQNAGSHVGMCYGDGPWREALSTELLPTATERYRYGQSGGPGNPKDSFSLPMASLLLDEIADTAISLVLDPSDPILELSLQTSPNGVAFERELLRLGGMQHNKLTFSEHLTAHAYCYRPALAFMVSTWPEYFEPHLPEEAVVALEGLGSYSSNLKPCAKRPAPTLRRDEEDCPFRLSPPCLQSRPSSV